MKKFLRVLGFATLCSGAALLAAPANAAHGMHHPGRFPHFAPHAAFGHPRLGFNSWRGGHWWHGARHGRFGWWWFAGGAWFFYPAPIYPYPAFDYYYDRPEYDDGPAYNGPYYRPDDADDSPDGRSWYYCKSPEGYYPYVKKCDGKWERVAPDVRPDGNSYTDRDNDRDDARDDDRGPPDRGDMRNQNNGSHDSDRDDDNDDDNDDGSNAPPADLQHH